MFRKLSLILGIFFLLTGPAIAYQLEKVFSSQDGKISRLIFRFDGEIPEYSISPESRAGISIRIVFKDTRSTDILPRWTQTV